MKKNFAGVVRVRVTYHSSRGSKDGVYLAKHNDRQFDLNNAEHIDKNLTQNNFYWHCFKKDFPDLTFEEAELKFYEKHFADFLVSRNQKYLKRHKDKIKTMADYLKSRKTCPEEIIFQIGNEREFWQEGNNAEKFFEVYKIFRRWRKEKFPNVKSLDLAVHLDEATPHIHERIVWIAHDDEGREMVHQAKALNEMGVSKFQPNKKENRYNNAKMVFTQQCREKFFELCRENGIEIEEKPQERSAVGLTLAEYKNRQEEKYYDELADDIKKLEEEKKQIEKANNELLDILKSNITLFENLKKYFLAKNAKKVVETAKKISDVFAVHIPGIKIETDKIIKKSSPPEENNRERVMSKKLNKLQ